jgi:hypothetical protein
LPKVGSNLGFDHQIQQVHTPLNVFTIAKINSHAHSNNPMPSIPRFLLLLKIKISRPWK